MIYFIGDINRIEDLDHSVQSKDIDEAVREILQYELICEDTETRGLDYTKKDWVILIQLGTKEHQYVFCVEDIDLNKLKPIIENDRIEKILANIYFERAMLRSIGLVINNTFDLLLGGRVLRQGRGERMIQFTEDKRKHSIYSLAGMYKEYLDVELDKEQQSSFLNYKGILTLAQVKYAARDVEIFDIYEDLIRRLFKYGLLRPDYDLTLSIEELLKINRLQVTVLEQKVSLFFADMLYNGIHIDPEGLLKLFDENVIERRDIEREMNKYVLATYPEYTGYYIEPLREDKIVQYDLFGEPIETREKKSKKKRINWNSPPQVKKILFQEVGERILNKDRKETVNIKTLDKARYKKHDLVNKYIEYKKLSKLISSYGENYLDNINKLTNRIHFSMNQVLTTGRIAPKKPNLAQIPSKQKWRDIFTAMDGRLIVGGDYSGQESRVMADRSGDEVFIDFFENGDGDSHSMIASRVYTTKEGKKIIVKKHSLECEVINGDVIAARQWVIDNYDEYEKIEEVKKENYLAVKGFHTDEEMGPSCPLRQKGKTLNFFISFGGSAYTLKDAQDIPLKEAEELLDGFWKGFQQLKVYFDAEKEKALKNGFVIVNTITNRRRWFPEWRDWRIFENKKKERMKALIKQYGVQLGKDNYFAELRDKSSELAYFNRKAGKLKGDMEREAMNTGIQGTAADMTKTASVLFMEQLERDGHDLVSDIMPVNFIHDELMLEVEKPFVEYSKKALQENMSKAAKIYCKIVNIPAKPYASTHWEH
jgi:DNA polymerase I-like protein with 3'-5' exonuclease and polymerase domains